MPLVTSAGMSDPGRIDGPAGSRQDAGRTAGRPPVRAVRNGPVRIADRPVPTPLRACMDALAVEMVDWGTRVGFSVLVRQADALVPGLWIPHAAYTAFCGLSQLHRGRIAAAMQQLPVTSLLPAQIQQACAEMIRALVPSLAIDGLRAVGDPRIVLGIAACALLYALQRDPHVPARVHPVAAQAVRRLRQLQAGLNVLHGASMMMQVPAPMPVTRASPRVPCAPQSPRAACNATAPLDRAGSACSDAQCRAMDALADGEPLSAWPLAGASARRGGRRRARPGAAPFGGARPAPAAAVPARRPQGASVGQTADDPDDGKSLRRTSANAVVVAQKESTSVARTRSSERGQERHVIRHGRKGGPRPNTHAAGSPGDPACETSLLPQGGCAQAQPKAVDEPAGLPGSGGPAAWTCLQYRPDRDLQAQLRQMAGDGLALRYCVPRREQAHFDTQLTLPANIAALPGHFLALTATVEHVPRSLRHTGIHRFGDLRELGDTPAPEPAEIGTDSLRSVLSISVRDTHARGSGPGALGRVLPANSFRLISAPELAGNEQLYVAYFVNRPVTGCTGLAAGHERVHHVGGGGFAVGDATSGFRFTGNNLRDFVAGLERLTGCRFSPPSGHVADQPVNQDAPINATRAQHLFVDETATWCDGRRYETQALKPDRPFILARHVYVSPVHPRITLYPGSFVLTARTLVYMEQDGRLGRLRLQATPSSGRVTVRAGHEPHNRRFLATLALAEGGDYPRIELIHQLEQAGLSMIPLEHRPGPT